jgi:hypothetical protein
MAHQVARVHVLAEPAVEALMEIRGTVTRADHSRSLLRDALRPLGNMLRPLTSLGAEHVELFEDAGALKVEASERVIRAAL